MKQKVTDRSACMNMNALRRSSWLVRAGQARPSARNGRLRAAGADRGGDRSAGSGRRGLASGSTGITSPTPARGCPLSG